MTILSKLAISLGRRDEEPNIQLAQEIARTSDKKAVKELISLLDHKNKNIQSDVIKVLGEIGIMDASLIAEELPVFLKLLSAKNNRMQWGAMAAIDEICTNKPAVVFKELGALLTAAQNGSVITKDRFTSILCKLSANKKYSADTVPLLLEQILKAPLNQLAMYGEMAMTVLIKNDLQQLGKIIEGRIPEIIKDSQRKRLTAILKKIRKNS